MNASVLRTTVAALATAAVLVTAGCAADETEEPTTTPTAEETADEGTDGGTDADGPVEVPDVTVLILETAEGNLVRAGLEVEVVDEAGAAVESEDRTAWIVTAQDPSEGTVEPGTVITLTVKPRA